MHCEDISKNGDVDKDENNKKQINRHEAAGIHAQGNIGGASSHNAIVMYVIYHLSEDEEV